MTSSFRRNAREIENFVDEDSETSEDDLEVSSISDDINFSENNEDESSVDSYESLDKDGLK